MRNKEIIRLLRNMDENDAAELAERYDGIGDHKRLLQKVEQTLSESKVLTENAPVLQSTHCAWRSYAAAAACLLLCVGTFAGMFRLTAQAPEQKRTYTIGEHCPAAYLTSSGTLWLTVEHAGFLEDGQYQITLTVENDDALAPDGSQVFLADNFLLAAESENGIWQTVSPCGISYTGEAYPYAYTLMDGEHITLTLTYAPQGTPLALVTSCSAGSPYITLTEESYAIQ